MPAGFFVSHAPRSEGRDHTRARLMDAAVEVFARHGIPATTVDEIARAAEVPGTTFFECFKDKDEIVGVVAFAIAAEVAGRIDAAMRGIEDAAERTSFATRQFVELATATSSWGWALVGGVMCLPKLRHEVSAFARADLERGVRDGVFTVEVDGLLVDLFASMVLAAILLRLHGEAGDDAGAQVAEHQLRMLGVPAACAKRVAWRPIEPLRFD